MFQDILKHADTDRPVRILCSDANRAEVLARGFKDHVDQLNKSQHCQVPDYVLSRIEFVYRKSRLDGHGHETKMVKIHELIEGVYDTELREKVAECRRYDLPPGFLPHTLIKASSDFILGQYDAKLTAAGSLEALMSQCLSEDELKMVGLAQKLKQALSDIESSIEADDRRTTKGAYQGLCNRRARMNFGANWWNHTTRKWYCQSCAFLLNDADPRLVGGKRLCTKSLGGKDGFGN